MSQNTNSKLLLGALLGGAALLTGDVILLATASGLGVNWVSEALPELASGSFSAGSPLAQAGQRALRRTLNELERQFRNSVSAPTDRLSFKLLRDTANSVVDPAYPPGAESMADLQQIVAKNLDQLLHGHNTQEVAFLRAHLLPSLARNFRIELESDDGAWRAFHGRLIEDMHRRSRQPDAPIDIQPLMQRLSDQQRTLDALRDGDGILDQRLADLQAMIERLEQQGTPSGPSFTNTDMTVAGNLNQTSGTIYQGSAHSEHGQASTHNVSGNQTNITGGASGTILSGTFTGPVTITSGPGVGGSVPPADPPDPQAIIRELERRLFQRQLTAARYGINSPPEVVIEIEDLERQIAQLKRQYSG